MTKSILIDGVHLDEVRVAVVNDDRLEEFDFENTGKKQIKGNIYLGKVTRVEPSLQAAFVEYGGNRQGFLPFSEIHYGYFHIPVADKEAIAKAQHEGDSDESTAQEVVKLEGDASSDEKSVDDKGAKIDEKPDTIAAQAEDDSAVETKISVSSETPSEETKPKRRRATTKKSSKADEVKAEAADAEDEKPKVKKTATKTAAKTSENKGATKPKRVTKKAKEDTKVESEDVDAAARKKAEELANQYSESDWLDDGGAVQDESKKTVRRKSRKKTTKVSDKDVSQDDDGEVVVTKARHFGPQDRKTETATTDSVDNGVDDTQDAAEEMGGDESVDESKIHRGNYHKQYKIQEVLKRGQIVLVQVIKEERGNKGASLTTYISLAGRYCVLMPNADRAGGVSRRIDDYKDRQRLKDMVSRFEVPQGMSVIVRTAGIDQEEEEIRRDYTQLTGAWGDIKNATMDAEAPALIHEEGSLIKCTLRDMYRSDVDEIIVQGDDAHKSTADFMKLLAPDEQKKLKKYDDREPLFRSKNIDKQLDDLYNNEANLPSGGSIVISPTEALVAIDVNSGKATKERSIEDTALTTNLEAANEVARQLRLRDLAGLVVIDFIDMREMKNRRAVERELKAALKRDRAKIQVGRISTFGLMEMSRQRMRSSIVEASFSTCKHCKGAGVVRSNESVAVTLMRAIELECQHRKSAQGGVKIRVSAQAGEYLLNYKRSEIMQIEQEYDTFVEIAIESTFFGVEHQFDKRKGRTRKTRNDNTKRDRSSQNSPQKNSSDGSHNDNKDNQKTAKKTEKPSQNNERKHNNQKSDRHKKNYKSGKNNDGSNNRRGNASNKGNNLPSNNANTNTTEKILDDSIGNRIDSPANNDKKAKPTHRPAEVSDKPSNSSSDSEGERSKIMDIWKKMTR